jgi:hypothetical protein
MVNRIHHVKGQQFVFTKGSLPKVLEDLQNPPKDLLFWASRVISRQLKGALNLVEKELLDKLLCEFDKEIKKKGPDNWLLCLPVALLLFMCVEEIQVQVDGFVRYEVSEKEGDPAHIYETGKRICCELEDFAEHCWLHLKRKLSDVTKGKNPLKYGLPPGGDSGYTEPFVEFVNELHRIIVEHGNGLRRAPWDTSLANIYHRGRHPNKDFEYAHWWFFKNNRRPQVFPREQSGESTIKGFEIVKSHIKPSLILSVSSSDEPRHVKSNITC